MAKTTNTSKPTNTSNTNNTTINNATTLNLASYISDLMDLTKYRKPILNLIPLALKKINNKYDVDTVLNRFSHVKYNKTQYVDNIPSTIHEATVDNPEVFKYIKKLPWTKSAKLTMDLKKVRRILNQSHYGLKDVKELVIQYIAALKFANEKISPPILCLIGNAGIGKTSILLSLAKALNTCLFTITPSMASSAGALMGVANKHPGAIVNELIKCQVNNPIIMFDEIDKLNLDHNESSYADLLNIFDPSLNKDYKDNFLQVPFNLSKAILVCTANEEEDIPEILRDRLYIVRLDNYSFSEKQHIAKHFLLKKIYAQYKGLTKKVLNFSNDVLDILIQDYTFESGVRQLNRLLVQIVQEYLAKTGLKGQFEKTVITKHNLKKWLKNVNKVDITNNEPSKECGVINNMISTNRGSMIKKIEVSVNKDYDGVIEVFTNNEELKTKATNLFKMCIDYLKINYNYFNIQRDLLRHSFYLYLDAKIQVKNLSDCAVGIMMGLLSVLKEVKIPEQIAFSSGITLKGEILSTNYFKEKVTAGFNSKVRVMLFSKHQKDELNKIATNMQNETKIHFSNNIKDVYQYIFNPKVEMVKALMLGYSIDEYKTMKDNKDLSVLKTKKSEEVDDLNEEKILDKLPKKAEDFIPFIPNTIPSTTSTGHFIKPTIIKK